jgi:hypothetical protein
MRELSETSLRFLCAVSVEANRCAPRRLTVGGEFVVGAEVELREPCLHRKSRRALCGLG